MNRKTSDKLQSKIAQLETGSLSVEGAQKLLAEMLSNGVDEDVALQVYEGLRAWVGLSFLESGTLTHLREWYALIEAVAAQFDDHFPVWAGRFEVLSDIVRDRIARDESRPAKEIMQRRHVPELLQVLARSAMAPMEREILREELGLKDANLSRVLRLAQDARLVEKVRAGKEAFFAITRVGYEAFDAVQGPTYRFVAPGRAWTAEMQDYADMDLQGAGDILDFAAEIEERPPLPMAA